MPNHRSSRRVFESPTGAGEDGEALAVCKENASLAAQGKPPKTNHELARHVYAAIYAYTHVDPLNIEEIADIETEESGAAALIDAYVRVREARITALIKKWRTECCADDFNSDERPEYFVDVYLKHADELESALATTRASQRSPREKPR